jgi:hypothetical protein
MYFIILVTILLDTTAAPISMPSIMDSYDSLEECRADLEWMAEHDDFKLTNHQTYGDAAYKPDDNEGLRVFFCARDMRGSDE